MGNIPIYDDYSNRLNPDCYTFGRQGNPILALVCHDTAGPNDFNSPGQSAAQGQAISDASARYLSNNSAQASVHWLVGAESCGAPIYKIVPETSIAYHCGGINGAPSHWQDPDTHQSYSGYGCNQISIGIERLGQTNDKVGPNQLAALQLLTKDIVSRYSILTNPLRTIAHAEIDQNRTDGYTWRDQARNWIKSGFMTTLPFGATIDTAGNIHINGLVIAWGFRDAFLTLNRLFPKPTTSQDIGVAIQRGVEAYGLPIRNEEDGKPYNCDSVQYFQRSRFEYHAKNQAPYDILFGLLGQELLAKL
jgi:hypothetical protein